MPGKKKTRKAVSQAQAGLFGAVIAGKATKAKSLKKKKAREKLRGVKVSKLPKRIGKK
jgi:hypothetical protein